MRVSGQSEEAALLFTETEHKTVKSTTGTNLTQKQTEWPHKTTSNNLFSGMSFFTYLGICGNGMGPGV